MMIQKAVELEDGEERDALIRLLANHMKKSFMAWNKESVDDRKILSDLAELSEGKITLNEESYKLIENRDILNRNNVTPNNNKKNYARKGR